MQDQIIDALRRGANDEALKLARANMVDDQHNPEAYRLLAMALRASGDSVAALASIDRAIALAPDDADLHFHRAGYLLGERRLDQVDAALAAAVQLDPNQLGAYFMQAQLALGRGDVDEAARIGKLAARVAPDHPWTAAIESSVALRRGDADHALRLLVPAVERAPDDAQVRYALGFAYMQKGHLAFAEQAFRGVIESSPNATSLWSLVAQLLHRQGRPAEAAEALAPLLDGADATPALRRYAGELELAAGRIDRALPLLLAAFGAEPGDARTLHALMQAWQVQGDADGARAALEAALATSPGITALWQARLSVEPVVEQAALDVASRWQVAQPGTIPPLEGLLVLMSMRGDGPGVEAAARRILAIEPGHGSATMHLVDQLMLRDPHAAIAHIDGVLPDAGSDQSRRVLTAWRGLAQDRAGRPAEAVATWSALHAADAANALPLPPATSAPPRWPPMAEIGATQPAVAFLVGAPGSGVDRLAALLDGTIGSFRADRYGPAPPSDGMQSYTTMPELAGGAIDPATVAQGWRDALTARGAASGEVIDWLLWWDNALLLPLRTQLPHASLLIALRDPRDMLLDWLAFGAHVPLRLDSPQIAADWLATSLEQVALLHEHALFPHALLRLDDITGDGDALTAALSNALQSPLPPPAQGRVGPPRLPPGHWRQYRQALAAPFASLTPVALRLGYPES